MLITIKTFIINKQIFFLLWIVLDKKKYKIWERERKKTAADKGLTRCENPSEKSLSKFHDKIDVYIQAGEERLSLSLSIRTHILWVVLYTGDPPQRCGGMVKGFREGRTPSAIDDTSSLAFHERSLSLLLLRTFLQYKPAILCVCARVEFNAEATPKNNAFASTTRFYTFVLSIFFCFQLFSPVCVCVQSRTIRERESHYIPPAGDVLTRSHEQCPINFAAARARGQSVMPLGHKPVVYTPPA